MELEPSLAPHTPKRRSLRLTIDSKLENVVLVGLAANSICRFLGMEDSEAAQVELCIVEAVTNSVRHAHADNPGREVTLTVDLFADRVEFQICDHGLGIPPEKLRHPRLEYDPNDIRSLPEGGMGVFLMHQIMDEVRYQRGDGANTLTLVRLLRSSER